MRSRSLLALAASAGLAFPTVARAQQATAGPDFRANTYTPGAQRWPEVHYRAGGDFIVSWMGIHPLDGSSYGIIAHASTRPESPWAASSG